MPGEDDHGRRDEPGKVWEWHLHGLTELGYTRAEAIEILDAGVDAREIARLIAMGCPRDLARRIA